MSKSQSQQKIGAFLTEADIDSIQPGVESSLDNQHRFKLRITAPNKKPLPVGIEPAKAKKLPIFKDIEPRYDVEVMRIKSYLK